MLTQPTVTQALGLWPVNARKKADAEYCAHLAVDFGRKAEIEYGINYDREAGQARNGIDLSKGQIQTRESQSKALSSRTHIDHR
jgi:hypothetical protein